MAKGQVSEEELTKGLKGIGNFRGLTSARVRRDNPFRDSRSEPSAPEPEKTIDVEPRVPERGDPGSAVVPKIEGKAVRPVAKLRRQTPLAAEQEPPAAGARKADVFTETVTLKVSPEMRDEVQRIARELQRAKSSKAERITPNSVMRAAILLVTKRFALKPGQAPNTEEELYTLVEEVLAGRRS